MKSLTLLFVGAALSLPAYGQVFGFTREQMIKYTAQNPFDRFPDGRPKPPDALLEKVKGSSVEEAWGVLMGKVMCTPYSPSPQKEPLPFKPGFPFWDLLTSESLLPYNSTSHTPHAAPQLDHSACARLAASERYFQSLTVVEAQGLPVGPAIVHGKSQTQQRFAVRGFEGNADRRSPRVQAAA